MFFQLETQTHLDFLASAHRLLPPRKNAIVSQAILQFQAEPTAQGHEGR
jgi:hypothetical protein